MVINSQERYQRVFVIWIFIGIIFGFSTSPTTNSVHHIQVVLKMWEYRIRVVVHKYQFLMQHSLLPITFTMLIPTHSIQWRHSATIWRKMPWSTLLSTIRWVGWLESWLIVSKRLVTNRYGGTLPMTTENQWVRGFIYIRYKQGSLCRPRRWYCWSKSTLQFDSS